MQTHMIWRIDGDFMFTLIPDSAKPDTDNTDAWVIAAIREEHESPAFDESEIQELIEMATNPDSPRFMGYEVIAIFENEGNLRFIA